MKQNDEIIDVVPIRTQVVICPKCGQKNRTSNEPNLHFRCGKCQYDLHPDTPFTRSSSIISNLGFDHFRRSKSFRILALTLIGILIVVAIGLLVPISSGSYQQPSLKQPTPQKDQIPQRPKYIRPTTDPYGHPWPTAASYIQGSKKSHTRGYSKITVDNKENDSDVYVKLVSLNPSGDKCVREFYIPARSQFSLSRISSGLYEIRCLILNSGSLSRTDSFRLEETHTDNGVNYTTLTLTLYSVPYGNMHSYPISPNDFYNVQTAEDEVPNLSFNSDPTGTGNLHVSWS
jgi:hypothetical protein